MTSTRCVYSIASSSPERRSEFRCDASQRRDSIAKEAGKDHEDGASHLELPGPLKAQAIRPPRATLVPQQRALNRFRPDYPAYRDERPHQFLKGATPAARYRTSPRLNTGTLPPIEYPGPALLPSLVTGRVLPMFPVDCVTYLPGCTQRLECADGLAEEPCVHLESE